ncbi:MAG: sensor histidine kinase, partial [Oscillospiraceae bacterium]|nr:sensor histidine kinase [Oscillospiraceae bacterium]
GNVCKYAMAGTRVYIDLVERDGRVVLSIKNVSRDQLNVSAEELMERFVRGDASRHTEGSGLGLNIARSLIDLMGGTFELSVDGDLFKAHLTLPAVEASASTASVPVLTEPELIARQKSRLAALTEEITARLKGG